MRILRALHGIYAVMVFIILFLIFLPLLLIPVMLPKQHHLIGVFNRWWAKMFFFLIFIPHKLEYRSPLEKSKKYIFCANHFSYLDIPTMGLNKHNAIFVGKSDMEKVPLFGFMYSKLHITVNRSSLKSRYSTFIKSTEALEAGKNLTYFPEGGILTDQPPRMTRFKDGAFRAAIEKQIAIIPVTIPFNWIILPDSSMSPRWKKLKVIFHEPLETSGLTLDDLDELKEKTFKIIDQELKRHFDEDRQGTSPKNSTSGEVRV